MRVSVCLEAILIPEYLAFRLFYSQEQNSQNIFQDIFVFRNILNDCALKDINQFVTWDRNFQTLKKDQLTKILGGGYVPKFRPIKSVSQICIMQLLKGIHLFNDFAHSCLGVSSCQTDHGLQGTSGNRHSL